MQPCKLTRSIATKASPHVGYDFATILTIVSAVLPVLANLIKVSHPNPTPADYRKTVTQRYRPKRDTYQPSLLSQAARAMQSRAAEKGVSLDEEQSEELARHFLDGVRTGSNEDIDEAMRLMKAEQTSAVEPHGRE